MPFGLSRDKCQRDGDAQVNEIDLSASAAFASSSARWIPFLIRSISRWRFSSVFRRSSWRYCPLAWDTQSFKFLAVSAAVVALAAKTAFGPEICTECGEASPITLE